MQKDDQKQMDTLLKPPEYRRNELGQFDRPGKTLSKTAKKNKKLQKPEKFGNLPGPGPGRPKGSRDKITVALKTAILLAGERAGGKGGLTSYLRRLAVENSSAYAGLLAKILPSEIAASESTGGDVSVGITFRRILVYPGGREEIEGVTPKQIEHKPVDKVLTQAPDDSKKSDEMGTSE